MKRRDEARQSGTAKRYEALPRVFAELLRAQAGAVADAVHRTHHKITPTQDLAEPRTAFFQPAIVMNELAVRGFDKRPHIPDLRSVSADIDDRGAVEIQPLV